MAGKCQSSAARPAVCVEAASRQVLLRGGSSKASPLPSSRAAKSHCSHLVPRGPPGPPGGAVSYAPPLFPQPRPARPAAHPIPNPLSQIITEMTNLLITGPAGLHLARPGTSFLRPRPSGPRQLVDGGDLTSLASSLSFAAGI